MDGSHVSREMMIAPEMGTTLGAQHGAAFRAGSTAAVVLARRAAIAEEIRIEAGRLG